MTEAIIWTVLWFVFIGLGGAAFQVSGAAIGAAVERVWPFAVGWALAVAWSIFALIQFVLQLVATIQLGMA